MSQRQPQRSQRSASTSQVSHARIVVALDLPPDLCCRATVKARGPELATVHIKVDDPARPARRRR